MSAPAASPHIGTPLAICNGKISNFYHNCKKKIQLYCKISLENFNFILNISTILLKFAYKFNIAMAQPTLYIIAGCNGAGKTTASMVVLPEIIKCREFEMLTR